MSTVTGTDWLTVCRRAVDQVRAELTRFPEPADRAVPTGRGEGGDIALVIDRAAEDAIFREVEAADLPGVRGARPADDGHLRRARPRRPARRRIDARGRRSDRRLEERQARNPR